MENLAEGAYAQDALHLWNVCVQPKLTFLLRTVPPHLAVPQWREATRALWAIFSKAWRGVTTEQLQGEPERVWVQASMPRRFGGLDFKDFEGLSDVAFTSSFWLVRENLRAVAGQPAAQRLGLEELFSRVYSFARGATDGSLEGSALLRDVRDATRQLGELHDWYTRSGGGRAQLLSEGFDPRVVRTVGTFEEVRASQHLISVMKNAKQLGTQLRPRLSATGWERLRHTATKESATWLAKPAGAEGRPLSSGQLATGLNFRLGLAGFHTILGRRLLDACCPRCSHFIGDAEELSRHVGTCAETAPLGGPGNTSWKQRHERVAERLQKLETLGGMEVRKEPMFPACSDARGDRADWAVAEDSGALGGQGADVQKYADVTIPTPGAGERGALNRAEREKRRKYEGNLSEGEFFMPYVVSPYGAFGQEMREGLWGSSRRAARHLIGDRGWGDLRPASTKEGLQAYIYEDAASRVASAVTESTIHIIQKVMDSMIADLQHPSGIRGTVPKQMWSQTVLLRCARRGKRSF